jgi:hypothetical protein
MATTDQKAPSSISDIGAAAAAAAAAAEDIKAKEFRRGHRGGGVLPNIFVKNSQFFTILFGNEPAPSKGPSS